MVKWLGKRKETFIESRGFSGVRKQERETPESSSTVSEDVGEVGNVTAQLPNNALPEIRDKMAATATCA